MKKLLIVLAVVLSIDALAQDRAIGVRLGDPTGLTIKKYTSNHALEFSIGRTLSVRRSRFYDDNFYDWYGHQNLPYSQFEYRGYRASVPIGMQLHYLFRNPISNMFGENTSGLEWYFGFGGQARMQAYNYDYRYKVQGDPHWYYATGGRTVNFDLGLDGVIGLEYRFPEVPLDVFLDATLFMEIVDEPFYFWGQAAVGARYRF